MRSNTQFGVESVAPMTALSQGNDSSFPRRVSAASQKEDKNRWMTMLPEGFEPTPYSVVCGRGRQCKTSVGNRCLQVIALFLLAGTHN